MRAMGSPFYGELIGYAADDAEAGGIVARILDAERGASSRLGVRLMAPLHNLALSGSEPALAAHFPSCGGDGDARAAWDAARDALTRKFDDVAALFDAVPQTNEPARSMVLLAGLLHAVAATHKPVRLFEIGASAGLNARLDAYAYEGEGWRFGDPASPLVLRNRIASGMPKHLDVALQIVERRACDVEPRDIGDERDRRFLQSYVWADQTERFERLRLAFEAASRIRLTIDRADAREWLRRLTLQRERVTVVMHSAMFEHLSPGVRDGIEAAIRALAVEATPDAPFAWLRMEDARGTYETRVTLWPSGGDTLVSTSDGHAQGIVWRE